MNKDISTINELLEHPNVQALISPEEARKITDHLSKTENDEKDPMYIRILIGVGAWFAAAFLLPFFIISDIVNSEEGAIICGVLLLAISCVIVQLRKGTFLEQLALALAFAGNILTVVGAAEAFSWEGITSALLMHATVCAVIYPLYPSTTYRFLAPIVLAIMATLWIIEQEAFFLIHAVIAAEMLLAGFLLLWQKCPSRLMPLAYASATTLLATLLFMNLTQVHLWRTNFSEPLWPSSLLLSGGLLYLLYLLLHLAGSKRFTEPWMMLALVVTVLLGIFTTPGILVAIALLVTGYAFGDRILTGLAYLFLPCFLIVFYYALHIDLAYKSYVVAGSGLLLLAVRWIVQYLQPQSQPQPHLKEEQR
jgi:MFS family permease